jgi:orotate phosphoribosyltransferase
MGNYTSESIEDAVMHSGVWHFGDYTFAGGKKANNKLEIPPLLEDPEVKELVLDALTDLIAQHSPDALWGVPSGGQSFAHHLGKKRRLNLPVVYLKKKVLKTVLNLLFMHLDTMLKPLNTRSALWELMT